MFRLVHLSILSVYLLAPALLYAATPKEQAPELILSCNISFDNYDHIDHAVQSLEITLSAGKHKAGGMHLVSQKGDYEFWVMVHGVQTLEERRSIINFQVAIKHKPSQLFMHALSDTSYDPDKPPHHARISLVNYHPGSGHEVGELFFECRYLD